MIQLYMQQYTGSTTQTLFHKLSRSTMQLLALAVLFFTLGMSQQVQAQAFTVTPQVVAGSLTTANGTGNIAVPRPIGLQEGDLILVNVSSRTQAATLTAGGTSAGFVEFGSSTSSTSTTIAKTFAFWKVATTTDVTNATYTFTAGVVAGGATTNRGFYVTAVRVAAGTFNPTTPIISGGVSTEASSTTTVTSITVPQLTGLPNQSVLMGFHATFSSISATTTPAGMSSLSNYNGSSSRPAQLLATQTFPSGGNTGDKTWSWTTARTAAGMLYAINPFSVPCSGFTGGLTSTTGGTYALGANATTTLLGDATLLQAGVTYTITYNLSGANGGTGFSAMATATTDGTLSFIPVAGLINLGTTTLTVTYIQALGCCLSPISITANNVATLILTCGSISSTYTSPINTQGINQSVVLYFSSVGPGTYTVTYNLSGANTVIGATATLLVSGLSGAFNIPASLLSNTGLTTVTITSIIGNSGCFTTMPAPFSFTVQTNNNSYGTSVVVCETASATCGNSNYANAFMASWNDPMTIEYDNFTSTFHSTAVRTPDGSFRLWGENVSNAGGNMLSPITLNAGNYPALGSHQVLKVTGGSQNINNAQFVALTTDGLYAWGSTTRVFPTSLKATMSFGKVLPTNGNVFSLPPGVSPSDVKMLQGTFQHLYLVTCDGDAWVLGNNADCRGAGGTGNWDNWSQVQTSAGVPITGIIAMRGNHRGVIALRNDNTIWTWGTSSYLGDGNASATRNFATQMVHPNSSKTIKMIGVTFGISYYVLMTDGNLYGLGFNGDRNLGDWTITTRTTWVQPRYTSSTGPVMNNIHWISPQEHDNTFHACINVLNKNAQLFCFGANELYMIGGSITAGGNNPQIPQGIASSDVILAVETGGHTSMCTKQCVSNFGYVGHRINGSMGNGDNASLVEESYTFNTASVTICAAGQPDINIAGIGGGPLCNSTSYSVIVTPPGGTLTVVSGPATLSGTTLTTTGLGSVTLRYTTPASVCGTSQNINKTFTVSSNNTVTVSTPQTLCVCTALSPDMTHTTTGSTGIGTPTGLPAGVSASWAANTITISGTPTATGTFNYTIPLTGGCGTVSAEGTIVVELCGCANEPTLTLSSTSGSTCVTDAVTVSGNTFGGSATAVTITHDGAGTVSPLSENSSPFAFTYTPAVGDAGNTVVITVTTNNPLGAPCVAATETYTLTVNPANTASSNATTTLCVNTALNPDITHTTTGATGIGTPTDLPAGVTASWDANVITISGTPTQAGTFNYSIPLTGGCGTVSATGTITVTADMTAAAPSATPTLCINTALTDITISTTGATGIGTPTGLPAGVTATWAANTITISGTPTASGTFNYSIPLTGGCGTVSATGTITVTADNTVTASTPQTLCINTALSPDMTHTTTGATGIGTPTGLPAGVTAVWAANTITISGTPTAVGTFTYSIPLTGGCGTVSAEGTIEVEDCVCVDEPTVTITSDSNVCLGDLVTLTGTFTNANNATWSIVSGGGSLSTTNCESSPCTTVYTPGATGTVVIRLVTDDPDGAGPCTAAEAEHTIIVRTVPVLGPVQRN